MINIAPLRTHDRERWEVLARGYKAFYETQVPDAGYAQTWQRLTTNTDIHGLGAHIEGRLVGIAHYLFHTNVWMANVCYLQDLFVDEAVRGQGAARALIEAIADAAREHKAARLYWFTRQDNHVARALYDTVATHRGFIRYERALD
ncbi:MAG: GNAT family N-acetyltransferase [Proteobacteria bacterium]|nr:GNAT family N-acetyltransferase [Pseudomonadota bacterium]